MVYFRAIFLFHLHSKSEIHPPHGTLSSTMMKRFNKRVARFEERMSAPKGQFATKLLPQRNSKKFLPKFLVRNLKERIVGMEALIGTLTRQAQGESDLGVKDLEML